MEKRKICSLKNSECNKKGILVNHYMCNRHLEKPESFVGVICKNFGTFSQEKWTNIENKLKSKYKQLIRKKNEDLVSLSQLDGSATYFALYTNESKNNEPIYIEILSFKDTLRANIGGNPFNIIVAYHSKKRGEELVKKYKEKQEIIDDL